MSARILFVADSHIGLDLSDRARVVRRRRGHDFLANHAAALAAAVAGEIDLVVHGGDVFDRPAIPASLARLAYEPLLRAADAGVPVCIVPGNHERGRLPHPRFLAHPRIHVIDRPRTFVIEVRGTRIALAGFPYEPRGVRTRFPTLLESTGWRDAPADVRLLCVHHCVEGATVGPGNYTFTSAADVIRALDIPEGFAAVLSGHIHRHQVLTTDLSGRRIAAPVLYPGSVERTATAEIGETKGYMTLDVAVGQAVRWSFHELPARPMLVRRVNAAAVDAAGLNAFIRESIAGAPDDAVLVIRVDGALADEHLRVVASAHLRSITPPGMNVEVRAEAFRPSRRPRRVVQPRSSAEAESNARPLRPARAPVPVRPAPGENLQLDL